MTDLVLVVHAAATWVMVGLSWTVRGVHYPLFRHAAADFAAFHRGHVTRITTVLAVPWAVEALSALALVFLLDGPRRSLAVLGLVLVVAIALLTWLGAVPLHGDLSTVFDDRVLRRLLAVDSARVVLWTARGFLAAALLL